MPVPAHTGQAGRSEAGSGCQRGQAPDNGQGGGATRHQGAACGAPISESQRYRHGHWHERRHRNRRNSKSQENNEPKNKPKQRQRLIKKASTIVLKNLSIRNAAS